jgi:hypothetical protein
MLADMFGELYSTMLECFLVEAENHEEVTLKRQATLRRFRLLQVSTSAVPK